MIAGNEGANGQSRAGYEDGERFAVAAMAFCLKYCPSFQADFLGFLAEKLKLKSVPGEAEFDIEPSHEADLVVSSRVHGFYAVVEFKINAPLGAHQDPRRGAAFAEGYGGHLEKIKATSCWANVCYVVIQQNERRDHYAKLPHGIRTATCQWSELKKCCNSNEALKEDLFDCLGWLKVNCMKTMKTEKTMRTQASSACQVQDFLSGILNDEVLGQEVRETNVDAEKREDGWHYGLNFSLKSSGLKGWLGYEFRSNPCPSIWFYCRDEDERKSVKRKIQNGKDAETTWVGYECPSEKLENEREWFVEMLRQVIGKQPKA